MRVAIALSLLCASGCVLDAPLNDKACDSAHACVTGFTCIEKRCVVLVGEGEGSPSAEGEGSRGEGEGSLGEGEGASSEGEGASSSEGEGASSGEGEGASSEGEGEGASAGEGEGAVGEGEGEGGGVTADGTCAAPFVLSTSSDNTGDTHAGTFGQDGSCSNGTRTEQVWSPGVAPTNETLALDLTNPSFDGVLYVRTDCGDGSTELGCVDNNSAGTDETLSVDVPQGQTPFVYVDGYQKGAYTLTATITPRLCGDGDLATSFEECDDGNTDPNDECDATCHFNFDFDEVEPNDDGQNNTGTNNCFAPNDVDLAAANAAMQQTPFAGPITASTRVHGRIDPIGDEDAFPIRNTTNAAVTVHLHAHGRLDPCDFRKTDVPMDTYLFMLDQNGDPLLDGNGDIVQNDDISVPNGCSDPAVLCDQCSALDVVVPANGTVYAVVGECGEDDIVDGYVLEIDFL